MNRRNFFSSLTVFAGAVSLSPQIFIPKFEAVKWKPAGHWPGIKSIGYRLYDMPPPFADAPLCFNEELFISDAKKHFDNLLVFGRIKLFRYHDGTVTEIKTP